MKRGLSRTFASDLDILFREGSVGGLSDRELLTHFKDGQGVIAQRAFEVVVGRYGPMVLGVCRRVLGDEQLAEDAFQATFVVLAIKPGAIRKPDSLGPWLHGVAARISRRARGVANRRKEEALVPGEVALRGYGHVEEHMGELRSVLDEEIGRLPASCRPAVVLCLLEGKTQEEAARELGSTRRTVAGRLARAMKLLRSRLARRGFAPSTGLVGAIIALDNATAAVPTLLSDNAVRTALGVALGRGEMITRPGRVVALARGMRRAMFLGKARSLASAVLMLAAVAVAFAQTSARPEPAGQGARLQDRPILEHPTEASTQASRASVPKLPEHASARLGTTRLRHQWNVWNVAFAPNGRTLASTGPDARIRFWDLATGEPASGFPTITEPGPWRGSIADSLAYSPDGTMLAIGRYSGLVQLWDLVAGKERFRSEAHKDRLLAIAFAPDGRTFATASDEKAVIRIWDVATGRLQRMLPFSEEENYGASMVFSPDGKRLALGTTLRKSGEAVICAWNLGDSAAPIVIRKPHDFVAGCNGAAILAGALSNDGTLISTAELVAKASEPGLFERYLPWKKNRQSSRLQVRFWDARTGERKSGMDTELVKHASSMTVSRDGKTLVTAHPDRLLVWDLATQKTIQTIPTSGGWCAAISPDGKTLGGARGHSVRLWDAATGTSLLGSDKSQDFAVAAAICPDGTLAATCDQCGNMRIWDPTRAEAVRALAKFQTTRTNMGRRASQTVQFSPDGRQLTASGQYGGTGNEIGVIRLYDVQSFRPVFEEKRIDRAASVLVFSFDGSQVAVVFSKLPFAAYLKGRPLKPWDDDVIELFSTRTGKKTGQLRGHGRTAKAIAFARDGKTLVSAGEDDKFHFWDIATEQATRVIPIEGHHTSAVMEQPGLPAELAAVAFSSDGAMAVTSAQFDDQLLVWDLQTGRVRRTLTVEPYFDGALAISPDGRLLAAAMSPIRGNHISIKDPETLMELPDTPIVIWDIVTKRERLRLVPGVRCVSTLAFAADGKTLISGMSDTTALVWDVSSAYSTAARPQEQ